jgi:hypothetical protein
LDTIFRHLRKIVNTIKHGPSQEQLVRIQDPYIDSFSETQETWADVRKPCATNGTVEEHGERLCRRPKELTSSARALRSDEAQRYPAAHDPHYPVQVCRDRFGG